MFVWNALLFFANILFTTSSIYARPLVKTYSPPQSALIVEYSNNKTNVLYQQNAHSIRHPASLTKMMTVYILLEALQSKKIKPTTLFRVSNFASIQMPSKLNLKPGSYVSAIDCVKALLVKSANDVAVVVAENLAGSVSEFCNQMNAKAKGLGMVSTHFENPSGIPNKRQVTTASDISKLGLALYKKFPQYWKYFALKSFTYKGIKHATHCKILGWYKGSDGAKTGFINASGFNLWVTAQRYSPDGKPKRLFAIVFGGHSGRERDFTAARLMDKFFKGHLNNKQQYKIENSVSELIKPSQVALNKTTIKTRDITLKESRFSTLSPQKQNNEVLYELDSMPIDDIIEMSGKTKEYFDDLYKSDQLYFVKNITSEEPLQIIETKSIKRTDTVVKKSINNKKINHTSKQKKSKKQKRSICVKPNKLKKVTKSSKQKPTSKTKGYRQSFNRTIDKLL